MLNDVVETHAPLKKKYIKKPTPVFINSDLRKAIHKYQNGKVT